MTTHNALHYTRHYAHGLIVVLFAAVFLLGQIAYAQTAADEPCDPEYWKSLKARAWLEAQREITQNQNLIFKPDSVLEYTCFDRYSAELAEHAKDMFSETNKWGNLLNDKSMDRALESLVGSPFREYLKSNFEESAEGPYDLLGGRLNDDSIDYDDSDWLNPIVGGDYACTIMNDVWKKAKCMDLIDNDDNDGFFTFTEYQNDPDKRFLPERCEESTRWAVERDTALENVPWTEDTVEPYLYFLDNGTCGDGNAPAFPTGLTVRHKNNVFEEKICIQPGCHYNPGSGCVSS